MRFIIKDKYCPHATPLEFAHLQDRAGKGVKGFLGGGVPMLPEERREFESMLQDGRDEYIGVNKVLRIERD